MNEVERGDKTDPKEYAVFDWGRRNPMKAAHPDWLIQSWWWQGNWNYAREEVRQYKLDILREIATNYDFDGLHLDFARHMPHLPPGKAWEYRQAMTEFLTSVRMMLQQRAQERNRPFLLAVRIPENLPGCRQDGLDVAEWVNKDLVDILVLGTRTMRVDLQAFRQLVADKNVKLIPSFDGYHTTEAYCLQTIELLRGVYSNWWAQGADSVGTFNWGPASPKMSRELGVSSYPAVQEIATTELGSPQTMAGKPRFYAIERRGGYVCSEGYFGRNDEAPLPVLLANHGTATLLPLHLWEEIAGHAQVRLRLVLFNYLEHDSICVVCNGQRLSPAVIDGTWKDAQIFSPAPQPLVMTPGAFLKDVSNQKLTRIDYSVDPQLLKTGKNLVEISVNQRQVYTHHQSITVEKVELHCQ